MSPLIISLFFAFLGAQAFADSSYYVAGIAQAKEHLKSGEYAAAMGAAKSVESLEPNRFEAYFIEAQVELKLLHPTEAIRLAHLALEKVPNDHVTDIAAVKDLITRIESELPTYVPKFKGTGFYNTWEVFRIDLSTESLMIRDTSAQNRILSANTISNHFLMLKQFAMLPKGEWYLPLGEQTEMELLSDQACSYVKLNEKEVPSIGKAELDMEFGAVKNGIDQNYPNRDAYASTIRLPLEDKIFMASFVISCKDPPGKRLRMAQERAALLFIEIWQRQLADILTKRKTDLTKNTTETDKASQTALMTRSTELLIKSIQNQGAQIRSFQIFLQDHDAARFYSVPQIEGLKRDAQKLENRMTQQLGKLGKLKALTIYLDAKDYHFIKYLYER